MPPSWNTTRIENRYGGGIPDVHVCVGGHPFWIELKTTKNNRINLSAHQVAWLFSYSQSGGVGFILVRHLEHRSMYLFDGVHGRGLAEHGFRAVDLGSGPNGPGSGSGPKLSGSKLSGSKLSGSKLSGPNGSGSGSKLSGPDGSGSGPDGSGSGPNGSGSGPDGSGSKLSGSGSGIKVPCRWYGSDWPGLLDAMIQPK